MTKTISFLAYFFLFFSLNAADRKIYEKIDELKQDIRDAKNKETFSIKIKNLAKQYPNSLQANTLYIESLYPSPLLEQEISTIKKNNKAIAGYLELKVELLSMGYSPAENLQKKEIIKKIVAYIEKNNSIEEEAIYDILLRVRDKSLRRNLAKKLIKFNPSFDLFQKKYVNILKGEDDFDELFKYCKLSLKAKHPYFIACYELSLLAQSEKNDKVKQLFDNIFKAGIKTKDIKVASDIYRLFNNISDDSKRSNRLVEHLTTLDKSWIPSQYYRNSYDIKNYDQYKKFSNLLDQTRNPDIEKRISFYKKQAKDGETLNIKYYAYFFLARHYENPAFRDDSKSMEYSLKAAKLKTNYVQTTIDFINKAILLNKKIDTAYSLIDQIFERYAKKDIYSDDDLKGNLAIVKNRSTKFSEIFLLKGKLEILLKDKLKAKASLVSSYALSPNSTSSYLLGKLAKQDRPSSAYDWLMRSASHKDGGLKKSEIKERDNLIKDLSKKVLLSKTSLEKRLSLYENQKSLLSVDTTKKEVQEFKHPLLNKSFPTLPLKDSTGKKYDWKKLKGKKVILSFWATWCTPCFQEMAVLNKMVKDNDIKDLKVVGICTDGIAQKKKVKKIMSKSKIKYDIVLSDGSMKAKYDVSGIPANFFINKEGVIIDTITGYSSELEDEIKKVFSTKK